jgi:thiol-disulfide isomerase/thioredoxin
MRRIILTLTIITTIGMGLWGCSIVEAPPAPPKGSIYVTAQDPNGFDIIGGSIKLDGSIQPEVTPDTILATVGPHTIIVEKAGFSPVSLLVNILADFLIDTTITLTPTHPVTIVVSASELGSGAPKSGSAIFLDGISTGRLTPDTLTNLAAGSHEIGVGLPGFVYTTDSVDIIQNTISTLNIAMPVANWSGVKITSSSDSARVSMDDSLTWNITTTFINGLTPGLHTFSCYKPAYANQNPILQTIPFITLNGQELSYNLTFALELWPEGVGYNFGQLAPGFTLRSIDINPDSASLGGYRGRVVLINFWFTACVPCMQEMPFIEQVYENYRSQGFRVLAVNPMYQDDSLDVCQARDQLGLQFDILLDYNHTQLAPYGVTSFPTNVLVDQRGVIDWRVGSVTYESLSQRVEALLNQ